jgi:hypothetical protein
MDADAALSMCGTLTSGGSGDGCNTVVPSGDCVVETVGTGTAPTPAGGAFVAGTYELVSSTVYAPVDGGTDAGITANTTPTRETSVATGSGTSFTFQNAIVSGTAAARLNGSFTANGASPLMVTTTCPTMDGSDNSAQVPYTLTTSASGTTLTTFNTEGGGSSVKLQVKVYKKR